MFYYYGKNVSMNTSTFLTSYTPDLHLNPNLLTRGYKEISPKLRNDVVGVAIIK